jgi:hypothetical protein
MRSVRLSFAGLCVLFPLVAACGETAESPSDSATSVHSEPQGDGGSRRAEEGGALLALDGSVTVADAAAFADARADADASDGGASSTCSAATQGGEPCAVEGAFCSPSPCTDKCQFCNVLSCTGGTWQTIEAFPLPQDQCADTFPCGAETCTSAEYCLAVHPGVALPDGGPPPPSYACVPFGTTCTAGCACAMSAAQGSSACTPSSCAASNGGALVQCDGV